MKFIIAHVINIFIIFVTEWSISLRTRKLHLLQAGCLCFWTGVKIWRVSVFWGGFFSLFSFWFTAHDNYRFFFASCQCLRSQCMMNFFRWFFESSVNHLVSQSRWHWFRTARNNGRLWLLQRFLKLASLLNLQMSYCIEVFFPCTQYIHSVVLTCFVCCCFIMTSDHPDFDDSC